MRNPLFQKNHTLEHFGKKLSLDKYHIAMMAGLSLFMWSASTIAIASPRHLVRQHPKITKKPVSHHVLSKDITETEVPHVLKLQASKDMVTRKIKKNCETWVLPDKGIVDHCDESETVVEAQPTPKNTQTDSTLSVIEFHPTQEPEIETTPVLIPIQTDDDMAINPELLIAPPDEPQLMQDTSTKPSAPATKPSLVTKTIPNQSSPQDELIALIKRLEGRTQPSQEMDKAQEKPTTVASKQLSTFDFQAVELTKPQVNAAPASRKTISSQHSQSVKMAFIDKTTTHNSSINAAGQSQEVKWPHNPLSFVIQHFLGFFDWISTR